MSQYITVGQEQLYYQQYGNGRRLLLALHGYGLESNAFGLFGELMKDEFTTIALDLPHHGRSKWSEDAELTKHQLRQIVSVLLKSFSTYKISVTAYSMGGRLALCIAEMMPEIIDQMLLIAADGLIPNPLYYFVTKNRVGKQIFKYATEEEGRLVKHIERMYRWNLIDSSRARFAQHYLSTPERRRQLSLIWPSVKSLVPNIKTVKDKIIQEKIKTQLVFGHHDRIIPAKNAKKLSDNNPFVNVHLLDSGHHLLQPQFHTFYRQLLLQDIQS